MIKYLPHPEDAITTIVEPFAGSLAYSLHHNPANIITAESNVAVRGLLNWLHDDATVDRIMELHELPVPIKIDVREIVGLTEAERTLLRLQVASVMVGQLSSWTLYPQHGKGLDKVATALPGFQNQQLTMFEDFRDIAIPMTCTVENTLVFVDPPYINTDGNYKDRGRDFGRIEPQVIEDWVLSLPYKVLMTYGTGAQELFPRLTWEVAMNRKVPDMRKGGSKERTEWFAKINW
jgi:site-specific DNA-adenine methylase